MLKLVLVFLKIGAAAFGGGWTIVGIIRNDILAQGWMTPEAFADLVAVAQITPGPVALNAATMVGFRLYGFWGAVIATLSVLTVPVALALAVSGFSLQNAGKRQKSLTEALKSATFGLLAMTLWAFAPATIQSWQNAVFAVAAFLLSIFTKINPIWIILAAGLLGGLARTLF